MRADNQRLFRIARSILRDDGEAEDVVQQSYVAAFTKLEQFEGRAALSTWLSRITANRALDRLRQMKRERHVIPNNDNERDDGEQVDTKGSPEELLAQKRMGAALENAVDALSDELRTVFVLRAVEGMSGPETAECLGIEEGTVRVRLHRARHQLRAQLEREVPENVSEVFAFAGERCDRIVEGTLKRMGLR